MSIQSFSRGSTALLLLVFLVACNGALNPPPSVGPNSAVTLTVVPQTNGVGTNREIAVVFSKPMDPASINAGSFLVTGVTGTVTYDTANRIAAFKAVTDFAPNTKYNASVTVAAKDLSGTPLAAPFDFSFTTRSTKDTSPPLIVTVNLAEERVPRQPWCHRVHADTVRCGLHGRCPGEPRDPGLRRGIM